MRGAARKQPIIWNDVDKPYDIIWLHQMTIKSLW